jgi:hypothetical protein
MLNYVCRSGKAAGVKASIVKPWILALSQPRHMLPPRLGRYDQVFMLLGQSLLYLGMYL